MITYIVGAPKTGKTTLGRKLAAERNAHLISTDDYLHLPHDEQPRAITLSISVCSNPNVIVEGTMAARLLPNRPDGITHGAPVPDEVFWCRGASETDKRYAGLASWINRFAAAYAASGQTNIYGHRFDFASAREMSKERTRQYLRIARAIGARKRRRKIPQQLAPRAIEASFARAMAEIVKGLEAEFQSLRDVLPGLMQSATAERKDAGERGVITALMEQIRARMRARIRPENLAGIAGRHAQATTEFQKRQIERQIRAGLGVDILISDAGVAGAVDDFVSASVALVRHLPEKLTDDVERTVLEAFASGETYTETAGKIEVLLGVSEQKAYHIAGQQVAQLNARVTELRQRNIGVDSYVWRTASDEKVRPAHRAREGNRYKWSNPPDGETPGNAPGWFPCRCYAEPVLDPLLGD